MLGTWWSSLIISSHRCLLRRNQKLCRHKNVVVCQGFPQSHHTPNPLQPARRRILLPSQRTSAMMHSLAAAAAASGMLVYSRYSSNTQMVSHINMALLYEDL